MIFPTDDGLKVLVQSKWTQGTVRVREFTNRVSMIAMLEELGLITPSEG